MHKINKSMLLNSPDNDTDSRNLIKITLNLVPRETCNASYGISSEFALGIVDEWQICAGNLRLHPSNPCQVIRVYLY